MKSSCNPPWQIAVIGAGAAGISCARTLVQAGCQVNLFEQGPVPGGRMASLASAFGSFDVGAQYFTASDPRFVMALETTPAAVRRWGSNNVQMLNAAGQIEAPLKTPKQQPHWVGVPSMSALAASWAQDIQAPNQIWLQTEITLIEPDALKAGCWQLQSQGPDQSQHVHAGFDTVLLAIPAAPARRLLAQSSLCPDWVEQLADVEMAPCWSLMLAFPQAMQPGLSSLGPQWNAARASHHRLAWLARESSKPGRSSIERWTVQASSQWSQEHWHDPKPRVQAKLLKAFAEVTGIHAEPAYIDSWRWADAKTLKPLRQSYLFDSRQKIGLCGDWCLGRRVENAFVSGLELALRSL